MITLRYEIQAGVAVDSVIVSEQRPRFFSTFMFKAHTLFLFLNLKKITRKRRKNFNLPSSRFVLYTCNLKSCKH